jgi:hypothetical protein
VWGALYVVDEQDRPRLDRAEGLGSGYDTEMVTVQTEGGPREALTYVATIKSDAVKPYTWYKHHVLVGAEEVRLPLDYVERIRAVDAVEDTNKRRHQAEFSIY